MPLMFIDIYKAVTMHYSAHSTISKKTCLLSYSLSVSFLQLFFTYYYTRHPCCVLRFHAGPFNCTVPPDPIRIPIL